MREVSSLNHTRWECKCHIVFIPKYRKRVLFVQIRNEMGGVFHRLEGQKESLIEEGHLMPENLAGRFRVGVGGEHARARSIKV